MCCIFIPTFILYRKLVVFIHVNKLSITYFIRLAMYVCMYSMYRLHHDVEVGMGFLQPRAESQRIV